MSIILGLPQTIFILKLLWLLRTTITNPQPRSAWYIRVGCASLWDRWWIIRVNPTWWMHGHVVHVRGDFGSLVRARGKSLGVVTRRGGRIREHGCRGEGRTLRERRCSRREGVGRLKTRHVRVIATKVGLYLASLPGFAIIRQSGIENGITWW